MRYVPLTLAVILAASAALAQDLYPFAKPTPWDGARVMSAEEMKALGLEPPQVQAEDTGARSRYNKCIIGALRGTQSDYAAELIERACQEEFLSK